ncbi:ABC transporter permease [Enterovirga sp. CN4-39]|uniref:ABC transporter permease n=1 Tax=Enterovirga sp. CN4-39 TaxID=3400910 RepID=UPI003C00FD79
MLGRQLVYRLTISVPVLLGVMLLGFGLMVLVPSDPAAILAGEGATPEVLARIRAELGVDRPIAEQFVRYLVRILQGDFGRSLLNGADVLEEVGRALPPTFELLVGSLLLAIPPGIALGCIAAVFRGRVLDRLIVSGAVLGISTPVFMTGLMLINIVGVQLNALPVQGRVGPPTNWEAARHIILPALTLALVLVGPVARMTRTSMLEIAGQDFVRTARAKGLSQRRVTIRHVLRNALVPTVNLIGLQAGYLLGGVVITETIFAWPGLGRLAVSAITSRDTPMAQGTILFLALSFVLINIAVDVVTALLDPRSGRV